MEFRPPVLIGMKIMRKQVYGIVAAVCVSSILAAGCGGKNQAETLPAQGGKPVVVSEETGNADESGRAEGWCGCEGQFAGEC